MPRVAPARPRATRTTIPGGVRFVIPARRHWVVVPFLLLWLCGWAFGEVTAIRELLRGNAPGPAAPFLAVWLALWTVGGVGAIAAVAWSLAGREVVSIASGTLAVRREAFGLGRTWEYDATEVRNVRVAPETVQSLRARSSFAFGGLGGGAIAFDHGARTLRFGAGLDDAEAGPIAEAIRERLPAG